MPREGQRRRRCAINSTLSASGRCSAMSCTSVPRLRRRSVTSVAWASLTNQSSGLRWIVSILDGDTRTASSGANSPASVDRALRPHHCSGAAPGTGSASAAKSCSRRAAASRSWAAASGCCTVRRSAPVSWRNVRGSGALSSSTGMPGSSRLPPATRSTNSDGSSSWLATAVTVRPAVARETAVANCRSSSKRTCRNRSTALNRVACSGPWSRASVSTSVPSN